MSIEIYGKPLCPYCDMAKTLCKSMHLTYTYHELGTDFNRDEVLELFPGAKTFPQIKVNNKPIGGYTELATHLEETNYNGTGMTL